MSDTKRLEAVTDLNARMLKKLSPDGRDMGFQVSVLTGTYASRDWPALTQKFQEQDVVVIQVEALRSNGGAELAADLRERIKALGINVLAEEGRDASSTARTKRIHGAVVVAASDLVRVLDIPEIKAHLTTPESRTADIHLGKQGVTLADAESVNTNLPDHTRDTGRTIT